MPKISPNPRLLQSLISHYTTQLGKYLIPLQDGKPFVKLEIRHNRKPSPGSADQLLYAVYPNGGSVFLSSIYPVSRKDVIGEINFKTDTGRVKLWIYSVSLDTLAIQVPGTKLPSIDIEVLDDKRPTSETVWRQSDTTEGGDEK